MNTKLLTNLVTLQSELIISVDELFCSNDYLGVSMALGKDGTLYVLRSEKCHMLVIKRNNQRQWIQIESRRGIPPLDQAMESNLTVHCCAVTVSDTGILYISDPIRSEIYRLCPGQTIERFHKGHPELYYPNGLTMACDNESLLVISDRKVVSISADGNTISTVQTVNPYCNGLCVCNNVIHTTFEEGRRTHGLASDGRKLYTISDAGTIMELAEKSKITEYKIECKQVEILTKIVQDGTFTSAAGDDYMANTFAVRDGVLYFFKAEFGIFRAYIFEWTTSQHIHSPAAVQISIKTVMLMRGRPCLWRKLPKEIILLIFSMIDFF